MRHRESQVGNTGFEVVHEAGDRAVELAAIVGNNAGRKFARNGSAWSLGQKIKTVEKAVSCALLA